MHRIYTNDLERERLRQQAYAETDNRLSLNRHRVYRASDRQLTVIGIIALERNDNTLYATVRQHLSLETGQRLDSTFEIVESRRSSRSQRHGFASNRLIRFDILPERVTDSFPLGESRALQAASLDRLV